MPSYAYHCVSGAFLGSAFAGQFQMPSSDWRLRSASILCTTSEQMGCLKPEEIGTRQWVSKWFKYQVHTWQERHRCRRMYLLAKGTPVEVTRAWLQLRKLQRLKQVSSFCSSPDFVRLLYIPCNKICGLLSRAGWRKRSGRVNPQNPQVAFIDRTKTCEMGGLNASGTWVTGAARHHEQNPCTCKSQSWITLVALLPLSICLSFSSCLSPSPACKSLIHVFNLTVSYRSAQRQARALAHQVLQKHRWLGPSPQKSQYYHTISHSVSFTVSQEVSEKLFRETTSAMLNFCYHQPKRNRCKIM